MKIDDFKLKLEKSLLDNLAVLQDKNKDWVVKGFIDIYKNVYTISIDTKVVSKIIELMLFPIIAKFAKDNKLKILLAEHQNHYPDITFIDENDGAAFAVDVKSTYRVNENKVNGFTLGAFTGYFRNRAGTKNITLPYDKYKSHFVLGVIYSHQVDKIDEREIYALNYLNEIISVIQEKYKIANSRPGSGNTKNIGSITDITKLKNGEGPFTKLGIDIFDDYWKFYQTKDMTDDGIVPYSNLKEYAEYKRKSPDYQLVSSVEEE
ncbi:MAG: EcoRV family type II restriction endonuclease [Endomicrobium sp.]|jgi:hypothetical protein|nr:EcoRV family type II restriction endonuclease [Endomicrobium sp.]